MPMTVFEVLALLAKHAPAVATAVSDFSEADTREEQGKAASALVMILFSVLPPIPAVGSVSASAVEEKSIADVIEIIKIGLPLLIELRKAFRARRGQAGNQG